jgi:hypothetical protein
MKEAKNRFRWLGLLLLSVVTLFVINGCGGGSSDAPAALTPADTSAKVAGTVTFPTSASVDLNSLGKRAAKSVALPTTITVELRDLSGNVIKTATATLNVNGSYEYSFTGIASADYVVKAISGNTVLKALVDKNSLSADTTRNVNTVSTTAVIVAEQKLGGTLGTLGDSANSTLFTSASIAGVNLLALESRINAAVGAVTTSGGADATQAYIDLMNLVNVVAATVFNNVNSAAFIAGTVTATISTTQYTTGNVGTGGTPTTVDLTAARSSLTNSVSSYTAPSADSVAFTSRIMDYGASTTTGDPVSGAIVSTSGLSSDVTTYTDSNGFYTLVGIPKNTNFFVKMGKLGKANTYSAELNLAANTDSSSSPYAIYTPAMITNWGNASGRGVISSRVVASTDLTSSYLSGVVVTATNTADQTTYPVTYNLNPVLTSTDDTGKWMITNVPAGATVSVTASKAGYTFNTRKFVTYADSVSQGRITGTAVPTPPATTSPAKAIFQSGMHYISNDYNSTTQTSYYYVASVALAADGVSLTETIEWYLNPVSKQWQTTAPAGFPTQGDQNNYYYVLTSSGVWQAGNDGISDTVISFNSDGSANISSKTTSGVSKITMASVNLAGTPVSSLEYYSSMLVPSPTVFPTGSLGYTTTWSNLTNDYSLWDGYGNALGTDLNSIPNMFIDGNGMHVYIDSNNFNTSFYAQFIAGASNVVNFYMWSSLATSPTKLATTSTYSITTVNGQSILEIAIPPDLRTQYKLGNNPIFAYNSVKGYVMQGDHTAIGATDYSEGNGYSFNDTGADHIRANFDISKLNKPALGKKLSKKLLGM